MGQSRVPSPTVKILSQWDKNRSSFTASRVEKCSFDKNAFKSLKSAHLLSKKFDTEGCNFENKIFLGTRPFAIYFWISKVNIKQKYRFLKILDRCYRLN